VGFTPGTHARGKKTLCRSRIALIAADSRQRRMLRRPLRACACAWADVCVCVRMQDGGSHSMPGDDSGSEFAPSYPHARRATPEKARASASSAPSYSHTPGPPQGRCVHAHPRLPPTCPNSSAHRTVALWITSDAGSTQHTARSTQHAARRSSTPPCTHGSC
jgi:hypothetical protein